MNLLAVIEREPDMMRPDRGLSASGPLLALIACLGLSSLSAHAQQPPPSAPASQTAAADTGKSGAPVSNSGFAGGPSEQIANPGIGSLFGSPFSSDHLFGDWGGARTRLGDYGIDVSLDWLSENAGNITGGRRRSFSFSGQVGLETDIDFEKMANLKGSAFHTMIVNGNGRNVSADAIGDDLATVQEIYGGRGNVIAHLVYAYWEQSLANHRIDISGGWMPVGTYFASSPLYCDFMNVLFCGNPHPLPNYPGEADWPQASFGGQIRVLATSQLYALVGLYSVDTSFGTGGGGISGWAWADPHKSGVSIPVELGWVPGFGRHNLVGHYKLGYDHDTHRYADVFTSRSGGATLLGGGPAASHGRDAYYVLVDQMLMRQGKGGTDGLVAFAGYVHASDRVSPLTRQAFVGMTSTGAAWGRPADTLGAAFHWIEMSGAYTRAQELDQTLGTSFPVTLSGFGPAYGPQNTEQVVELDYTASVFRGVSVMPDFQYIIRPGATTRTPDAAVLGFRTNVNF